MKYIKVFSSNKFKDIFSIKIIISDFLFYITNYFFSLYKIYTLSFYKNLDTNNSLNK